MARSTVIKKVVNDVEEEYTITFEDLTEVGLIGQGRFGIVKKMRHSASNSYFAVKVGKN